MKLFSIDDYQFPVISSFFLFFSMIGYWISLAFPKNNFSFSIVRIFVLLSNLLFFLTLLLRWIGEHYFPLSNLYESLIFLSWFISTIHLVIEQRTKSRLLGSITTPILFFLSGFSSLTLPIEMQKALPLVPSLQSNWLMMHVSMMMVSYATLIIGSLFSLFYLAIFYFKSKEILQIVSSPAANNLATTVTANDFVVTNSSSTQLGIQTDNTILQNTKQSELFSTSNNSAVTSVRTRLGFSSGSSSIFSLLQTIDIWSYRIIGLGFPFLTIGIISGAVWANEAWGAYWSWDPKETWALITWLVFAVYLHSRLLKGWQGEKAAIVGSFGFFVIWICYLGVNFLGKGLHSYGWVLN